MRAAGGADGGEEFAALAVEDQGRGHGRARAFAGLDAVGDFLPVLLGDEREVGHLVVEQETLNHQVRAERGFDGGGHRHRAACVIDRHHLRGGDAQRRTVRRIGDLDARRRAGFGRAHAALADQGGAAGQVGRVDQAFDRHGHEVGVGHVLRAVGVGQAFGFGDQVHGLRAGSMPAGLVGLDRFQRCQRQALVAGLQGLQRAEDLRHGDPARRRRRHAADLPALVVGAQRRALLGLVAGEIVQRQAAGVGVPLNLGDDFLGDRAFVQRIRRLPGRCV